MYGSVSDLDSPIKSYINMLVFLLANTDLGDLRECKEGKNTLFIFIFHFLGTFWKIIQCRFRKETSFYQTPNAGQCCGII